jgi:hypothetical protein
LAQGWISSYALTEANHGSDIRKLDTKAVRKDDSGVLNGENRPLDGSGDDARLSSEAKRFAAALATEVASPCVQICGAYGMMENAPNAATCATPRPTRSQAVPPRSSRTPSANPSPSSPRPHDRSAARAREARPRLALRAFRGRHLRLRLHGGHGAARCIFAESLRYVATQSKFMTRGEYLPDVCALPVPLQLGGEDYAVVPAGPLNRIEPRLQ